MNLMRWYIETVAQPATGEGFNPSIFAWRLILDDTFPRIDNLDQVQQDSDLCCWGDEPYAWSGVLNRGRVAADGADHPGSGRSRARSRRSSSPASTSRRSWPTRSTTASRTSARTPRRSSSSTGRTSRTTATCARQLKRERKEKAYQFMVRVRIVGGKLTADQYLACDELARTVGNGTLRITTRQEFQLHGVLKDDLTATIRRINEILLSTLAACGDVERNVLCCPAPIHDALRDAAAGTTPTAGPSHCAPRSSSYWDIWLDGEKIETAAPRRPVPGADRRRRRRSSRSTARPTCPRKFKTAFALPDDNCTDIHANDLGFLAIVEDGTDRRLQRPGRRRPGHDPERPEDVPVPGRAALLRRPRRRARDRRGGAQGLPRLRQPLRPQAGPAQVHHPRLGPARLPGQGRGVPRPPARRPEAGRRHRRRRPPRLARAGRRQALPGHPGRERPDQGRGRLPARQRPAGVLREVPDARPG